MIHILAELAPLKVSDGSRPVLRASSAQDRALNGVTGQKWWPAISKRPALAIPLFDGDFTQDVEAATASFTVRLDGLVNLDSDARGYRWAGAPVSIYAIDTSTALNAAGSYDVASLDAIRAFKGRVEGFNLVGNALTITAEIDKEPFEKDVLALTYAGTGDAEGGQDLKGRLKPWIFGRALNVEPILVNSVDSVVQFSAYPVQGISALYERGASFGPSIGNYPTYAALVAANIPAGKWATCHALGMARLGAPPYGVITGDVDGDNTSGFLRRTGAIIQRVATARGIAAALIDTASLNALDAAVPYDINLVLTEQISVLDLARRLARPCNAQAGLDFQGRLFAVRPTIGTPALTLDAQGRQLPPVRQCQEAEVSAPYKRIMFGANRSWRVHTFDEIAFDAELIDRGDYDPAKTYRRGNIVSLPNGSRWLYVNDTPKAGSLPAGTNTDWELMTGAITAGNITYEDGTPVEDLKPAQPGATNGASAAEKDQLAQLATDTAAAKVRIAQAEQDIEDLFETYGDSASAAASAAAAANSASAAQGYASTASSASANAGTARDQAQTAQGAAASSAAAAANAKTDAEAAFASSVTARNAAQAAQTASETARNQAQTYASNASGSATAAAGSATTASTAATNAGNSATAAAASAVSASSSYDGARLAAVSGMPSDFINDGEFWSSIFYVGAGLAPKITADSTYSFPTVSGIGKVAQIVVGSSEVRLSQIGLMNLVEGRRYRITASARKISGSTGSPLRLWRIGWQSSATTVGNASDNKVADALNSWVPLEQSFNASDLITPGAVGVRAMMSFTDAGTYQVQFIRLEDITESTAAATSSAAAATSASAAGQSATAAQNSATSANTSAGNASTSAGQASTSATNAAGSASAAQTSATNAAGSATAAGNSASAASSSASTASTKATEASQSASAAAGSATTASTKAGEASTSASQAAASVTTAAGHAATAQTQATNAANSATAAGNSASAASNSASTAQTAANNAGSYATAAQQSSVSATLSAASTLPIDFTNDGEFWTNGYTSVPASTSPIVANATYSFENVSGVGRVMQVVGTGSNIHVGARGWLKAVAGRLYRLTARIRALSGSTATVSAFGIALAAGGGQAGGWSGNQSAMVANQWYDVPRNITGDDVLAANSGAGAYLRPIVRLESAVTYQIAFIRLDDVTESNAASGSASAAAASASAASASQTAAGNSASAAQTSATNAATSAGNASTFAGNASTSATQAATSASNAAGSASTASTQATNAANSATAAGNSATAAAGSASTASTQATNAGNSASAAAASAVSASSSYDAARTTAATQMPFDFQNDGEFWSSIYYAGAGLATKITANAKYSFPTVDGIGKVAQITVDGTGGTSNIAQIGLLKLTPGRRYRISTSVRQISGSTGTTVNLWRVGWQSGATTVGNGSKGQPISALNTWYPWSTDDFTADALISAGAVGTRAFVAIPVNTGVYQIQFIRLEDVTESAAAAGSASAAASSASSASTSATNAANSASAASSSATTASTQAGNASSSASSASTSAANASSSATNAANSATSASGYANTAQTKAGEASASASAASSSASAASASASSAQTSATNASTYAGQAQSSATAASTSATVASDAAAAAQTSATVSAQVAAASINPNPVFANWSTGSTYPTGYVANGTAPTITKPTGKQSPYALGTTLSSSTASSIGVRTSVVQDASVTASSWIVLEVDAQLGSGTYQGAGVLFRIVDSSGTETVGYKVSLYSDPDIAGATGNASGVRRWRRLVQITGATPNGWQIFIFNRWSSLSGYTSSATSNYIEWSKVSFRPATDQEIASKQATADIAGLSATVTQQASTLATLTTQYASLSSTVTAQGATVSQQATAIASLQNNVTTLFAQYVLSVGVDGRVGGMKLANNGSTVGLTFRSDIVRFEDPDPGTGAMEWYDQAIRMTDGAGKLRMFMGYRA